ncbi:MAG: hypothetical protein JSU94_11920 [Phycisphaerales bacterium]|nr:MAG: hypothetical protein JSU94_11920 [Phycisphaerales bacterium]
MNAAKLILTEAVSPPSPLRDSSRVGSSAEERKKRAAKEFESVLIGKLLDQMKNTIGDWGFEKEGSAKQVQGIFWMYLANDIAGNGGLGMWKDIYEFFANSDRTGATVDATG